MPSYLRIGFRADRWLQLPWLPADEVQADAVKDFNRIKDNEISVYLVNSEVDGIRAAIAIASKVEQEKAFGYALFDAQATTTLGIVGVPSEGETPDAVVNGWHHELQRLTFGNLAEIAKLIKRGQVEEIPLPVFKQKLQEWVEAGQLDREQVHRKNLE